MKAGMKLAELAEELKRRSESKVDYDLKTHNLAMDPERGTIRIKNEGEFAVSEHAHGQIAARLNVPKKYYDRMRVDAPDLLATNVNHWFNKQDEHRLVRTLDGSIRAVLSAGYLCLDNWDLARLAAQELQGIDAIVKSCQVTDNRLYIQAVTPKLQGEIRVGDVVQSGIIISNSEVGLGNFLVEPLLLRLVCLNGLISNDHSMKRRHVTRRMEGLGDDGDRILSNSTKRKIDDAFWHTVRDVIRFGVSEDGFQTMRRKFVESTEVKVKAEPEDIVERVSVSYLLTEGEKSMVLRNYLKADDNTKYGLVNAVTAVANLDDISYDRAVELERLGGEILEAPKSIWDKLDATDEKKAA